MIHQTLPKYHFINVSGRGSYVWCVAQKFFVLGEGKLWLDIIGWEPIVLQRCFRKGGAQFSCVNIPIPAASVLYIYTQTYTHIHPKIIASINLSPH